MTLRLFEADLPSDSEINADGFYMMVLAVDLEQAKKYIEIQLDYVYRNGLGGSLIEHGEIIISEVQPPFPKGRVLCAFSYPHKPKSLGE